MRIVVTGATGNIGSRVVEALLEDRRVTELVGVARRPPAARPPRTEWVAADVADDDLAPIIRGADAVVHLAWRIRPQRRPRELERTNVHGSERVFTAAASAGARALVVASSVGAYSPGPEHGRADESWPTGGIQSSLYSRQKSRVEALLDRIEADHPAMRVVRIRPALAFQRPAAAEIKHLFAGDLLPRLLFDRRLWWLVPGNRRLRTQVVHTTDLARAFRAGVLRPVRGAFNVAAEPPLDGATVADALGAWRLPLPLTLMRAVAALSWRLRLQPSEPGWLDLAVQTPLMDTARARRELDWAPRVDATRAFVELLDGIRDGDGPTTPPLDGWAPTPTPR